MVEFRLEFGKYVWHRNGNPSLSFIYSEFEKQSNSSPKKQLRHDALSNFGGVFLRHPWRLHSCRSHRIRYEINRYSKSGYPPLN